MSATNGVPSIPYPKAETDSLHKTIISLKEAVEVLTKQRGDPKNSVITWQHLVDLGLITSSQIPLK